MPELEGLQTETPHKAPADISPRAESLTLAQRQLSELCASSASRSELDDFLATWRDPLQPDRVQPNALVWFQAAEPIATAISNGCEDAARVLLAYGVRPERPDAWAALDVFRNTGSKIALELLLEGGWNIDRSLNDNATSILG